MLMQRYKSPKRRARFIKAVMCLVLAGGLAILLLHHFHTKPVITTHSSTPSTSFVSTGDWELDWPDSGEAAIGIAGSGVLATHGAQTSRATASTAKLITALTVLKKYPLQPGQSGPKITLTIDDVRIYNQYLAEDGSSARVLVGAQISEYQMLEAVLIPSANNIADSLAIWAYGSLPTYQAAATQTAQSLGLAGTTIGSDASGLSPDTVSTAHDLVVIGEAAMENPVIAEIVGISKTTVPVFGEITNYNTLLGHEGIVGVKTGNSDEAGGVYVFAADYRTPDGQNITIVGAVQGLPDLPSALQAAKPLLKSTEQNIDKGKLTAVH